MFRRWCIFSVLVLVACTSTGPRSQKDEGVTVDIVWPKTPEPARIRFVSEFRSADDLGYRKPFFSRIRDFITGVEDRRMLRPYAIAVNSNKMVVADPGAAIVHLFDRREETYHKLNRVGEYTLRSPIGVALGSERIFIADSVLGKVFVLDNNFRLLNILEDLQRPTGLAFDQRRQRLYVADTLAHGIVVYNRDGKFQFTIGERGEQEIQFNYPSHLVFADDRLFVNDTLNFRIQVFSPDGHHLKTFGKQGDGSGHFAQSKGLAVDSDGHVYIADALANRVQIFDQDGVFLLGFGSAGDVPGAFQMPTGLAIWDDMIYVADSYNQRVQVFQYLKEVQ